MTRETSSSPIRDALGYIGDRFLEILIALVGGNAIVTYCVIKVSAFRHWFAFVVWALVGGALVFIHHFESAKSLEAGAAPKPWRMLLGLQLGYVAVAWAWLGCC